MSLILRTSRVLLFLSSATAVVFLLSSLAFIRSPRSLFRFSFCLLLLLRSRFLLSFCCDSFVSYPCHLQPLDHGKLIPPGSMTKGGVEKIEAQPERSRGLQLSVAPSFLLPHLDQHTALRTVSFSPLILIHPTQRHNMTGGPKTFLSLGNMPPRQSAEAVKAQVS